MTIRTTFPRDQAGAIGVLRLAFSTDPMARWSLPDPAKYLAIFSSIAKAFGGNAFEKGTAYIANLPMIGVDPAHQGAGTGSALMTEVEKSTMNESIISTPQWPLTGEWQFLLH
jgi:GNAT superfamily N-acetyltransferase